MPWQDRLKNAAYISPSGERIAFDYEIANKTVSKKTVGFEFPDADGTYVQDLGHTGNRYPLRIFFSGDDHDLIAKIFDAALLEKGVGMLEHPVYGPVDVVPFGDIRFINDLKTATNQTIVEVTFWETIDLIYPTDQGDPTSEILAAIDDYNNAVAETFEIVIDVDTEIEKATLKNEYTNLLDSVESNMQSIVSVQEDVQKQFNVIVDSINNGIDVLVAQPLTLAFQTSILIQAPARASASIADRLNAYNNLLQSIITSTDAILMPSNDSRNVNTFHNRDLYASNYVAGSIISIVNNQFITKVDALTTAEFIIDQMNSLIVWRDNNFESLSIIDTGEAYQQLLEAFALAVGFLIEISFNLKQERRITLEEPHTIIDLIAELYPPESIIDDELDFFIQSNKLTGSEILELPRGREIVYYV